MENVKTKVYIMAADKKIGSKPNGKAKKEYKKGDKIHLTLEQAELYKNLKIIE